MRDALQDAYLAWVQGAEETRAFSDFASWAIHRLAEFGFDVVARADDV